MQNIPVLIVDCRKKKTLAVFHESIKEIAYYVTSYVYVCIAKLHEYHWDYKDSKDFQLK